MVRPKSLRTIGGVDGFKRMLAGMGGCERAVPCRMPILSEDYVPEPCGEMIDQRHDCIAVLNGEMAAGTEITLRVDDQENVFIWSDLH